MVIVFAQETQDVVNALTWARQNDVAVRVRSGGHRLEGWSNVDNGIVIDVSELKSVHIDTDSRIATVGAGLNQLEAVTALGEAGPRGRHRNRGHASASSGATLGGGFGFLTRYLGMACDNLMAAEVVVASGDDGRQGDQRRTGRTTPTCSGRSAERATATSASSPHSPTRCHPLTQCRSTCQATWPGLDDLPEVFEAWQRTAPFADNRLGTQLEIHRDEIPLFGVLARGSEEEAKQLLAPILSVGSPDVSVQVGNWGDIYAGFQIPPERRARELEVLLAVRHRTVPERERSA